ncbi:MAG: ABC transporter ATP-binding protein [Rhodospirillales bacterium]|nr:ABC transporter ATP-binding protein [Rhodospirillales bacterium]MCB9996861.1 ABC transporter ATP-binding protein [Rhodospirillales bacterium]
MRKTMTEKVTYKDVLRYAGHYWKRQKPKGAAIIALMTTATVIDVFVPVYTGKIIDALTGEGIDQAAVTGDALTYLGIFAVLAFSFNVLRWGSISLWATFSIRVLYEILSEALHKVQRFSADWHANAFAGGTVRKMTRGMWAFDVFGDTILMGLYPAAIIALGITIMLLVKLPLVGLFTAVMIAIYTGVSIWMSVAILAPRFRKSARADTKVGATLADIMTGNATVKAFGAEKREDALFRGVADNWRQLSTKAWVTGEVANFVRGMLRALMMIGMIGATILMWRSGTATAGDIALALTSFFLIGGYLRDIGMHIANLQKAVSEMEDIIGFWMREDDVRDRKDAAAFKAGAGEITFDKVRFTYNGQHAPIYDDFSIRIAPGEKVALVGHSGSGKSTFVKLVQRLYDVQGGAVRIDGQDIAAVTQDSLRASIALVPQEPILFHRSLAENIAYGRPEASMDEIIAAAKKAYAHDFIMDLPLGYDTLVGERGVKLSGGERQRVAIARAILSDAQVLILDEATSALDSVSEHYIQKALEGLMENRTTITIAHRLATIRQVDRILVFDKGRVVEQGRHDELVAREHSVYRRLYEMQALGLSGDPADNLTIEEKAAE